MFGADDPDRTGDFEFTKFVLYQLSYASISCTRRDLNPYAFASDFKSALSAIPARVRQITEGYVLS